MKCVICNQEFDSCKKIARHIRDKHNISTKEYYNIAVYVWSILDVRKFKYARDNKLNYLAFYTEDDLKNWFYS